MDWGRGGDVVCSYRHHRAADSLDRVKVVTVGDEFTLLLHMQ
jgi:hypothetical protein